MKQINFKFETLAAAAARVSEIRATLDSHAHSDAAAFVFISNCVKPEAERLLEVWNRQLPDVKRVGISEGYATELDPDPALVKFNLIISECGEVFHPFQIPCGHGGEAEAAAEMNRHTQRQRRGLLSFLPRAQCHPIPQGHSIRYPLLWRDGTAAL